MLSLDEKSFKDFVIGGMTGNGPAVGANVPKGTYVSTFKPLAEGSTAEVANLDFQFQAQEQNYG